MTDVADDQQVVEWNPDGEEWIRADLLHGDATRAVIRLWETGQTLTVERKHLRTLPRRCELDYADGVCLSPLDGQGRCSRPHGEHDADTGVWVPWGEPS